MNRQRLRPLSVIALPLVTLALTLSLRQDPPEVDIPKDPGPALSGEQKELPSDAPLEWRRMQEELGTWDAEIHSYMAAGMRPVVSAGVEINRMLGDAWMVTDFEGVTFGQPYQGRGQTSYDLKTQRAVGTWIDTFSPALQMLDGTYNLKRRERVFEFESANPDGSTSKTRWTKRSIDARHRVFDIMSITEEGEEVPVMKILYTLDKR